MNRTVTLTDAWGHTLGTADLLAAHTGEGMLHLAFSVYLFDTSRKCLLIQRRSEKKMLWPLIWANTCCSHPFENESAIAAGERRLREEFGFSCPLIAGPSFIYRAVDPAKRGVEHEYVTILTGTVSKEIIPMPDPKEIDEWKWVNLTTLQGEMTEHQDSYAPWFHLGLQELLH